MGEISDEEVGEHLLVGPDAAIHALVAAEFPDEKYQAADACLEVAGLGAVGLQLDDPVADFAGKNALLHQRGLLLEEHEVAGDDMADLLEIGKSTRLNSSHANIS